MSEQINIKIKGYLVSGILIFSMIVKIPLAFANSSENDNHKILFSDLYQVPVYSVYDLKSKHINGVGGAILSSTIILGGLSYYFLDSKLSDHNREAKFKVLSSKISDVGLVAPYIISGSLLLASYVQDEMLSRYTRDTFKELIEAQALTLGMTSLMKVAFNRERPRASNNQSFPSGHTSMMFSTAGILMYRYPWYISVPVLTASAAVAASRVDLNKHFVSDVVVGAGLGLLIATGVNTLHRKRRFSISPFIIENYYGLAVSSHF